MTVVISRQARVDNGGIQVGDWQEELKVVVTDDGESSSLYPLNLATLYEYESKDWTKFCVCKPADGAMAEEEMKNLLHFYGINVDTSEDWRKRNMNRFMQFIGKELQAEERPTLTDISRHTRRSGPEVVVG